MKTAKHGHDLRVIWSITLNPGGAAPTGPIQATLRKAGGAPSGAAAASGHLSMRSW